MLVDKSESDKGDPLPRRDEAAHGTAGPMPRAKILTLLVIGAAVGIGVERFFFDTYGRAETPSTVAEKAEPVLRSGNTFTVPDGSPVRNRLVIAPVAEKNIKRDLVLPAVVEADPAHLIKVSPPVAGRVT